MLRLNKEADVIIVLLNTVAQINTKIVGVVLILRIAAEVAIEIIVES